ncbi:transmembrane channel-like protein 7 isoform X2 [Oscarella lobularis]|uniref:transmembrane channel-like protein 7 isoform X2 n=1 Tax=Oscarella lobularis TaxID=121494 RepID=UPI0033130BE9
MDSPARGTSLHARSLSKRIIGRSRGRKKRRIQRHAIKICYFHEAHAHRKRHHRHPYFTRGAGTLPSNGIACCLALVVKTKSHLQPTRRESKRLPKMNENVKSDTIIANEMAMKTLNGTDTIVAVDANSDASENDDDRHRAEAVASQMSTRSVLDMLPSRRRKSVQRTVSRRRRQRQRRNPVERRMSKKRSRERMNVEEIDGPVRDDYDDDYYDDDNVDPFENPFQREATLRRSSIKMSQKLNTMRTLKKEEEEMKLLYQRSCWKAFKYRVAVGWKHFKDKMREIQYIFNLWWKHLKQVESYFGTGVVSYFIFLRWVFLVNVLLASLWFFFVFIPQVVISDSVTNVNVSTLIERSVVLECMENVTNIDTSTECPNCTTNVLLIEHFINKANSATVETIMWYDYILNFFTGTGWMERTSLFIGHYSSQELNIDSSSSYNLPLAYIIIGGLFFFLSLIFLVHRMASAYRQNFVEGISTGKKNPFFNLVFTAWDFAITNLSTAKQRHLSIKRELEEAINTDRAERVRFTFKEKAQIWIVRLLINLVVIILLAAAGAAIYYAAQVSIDEAVAQVGQQSFDFLSFLRQLAASLTISVFNVVYPFIFELLVRQERYKSPAFEFRMTIVRSVALRVSGLVVLMATLLKQVQCSQSISICGTVISVIGRGVGTSEDAERVEAFVEQQASCKLCWETYVGQEVYRLLLVDFLVDVLATLLHESLRHAAVAYIRFVRETFGKAEFTIAKSVLNLVYSQALIWIGAFYAPLLPLAGTLMFFVVFYVKKYSLMWNCQPSRRAYRATKTSTFFLFLLLVTLFVCLIPIGYSMVEIQPSAVCGPFSGRTRIYNVITEEINKAPEWLQVVLDYIGSAAFVIPFIIILCIVVYYFISLSRAYKKSINILEHQLQIEGRDKQFLIKAVSQQSMGEMQVISFHSKRVSEARLSVPNAHGSSQSSPAAHRKRLSNTTSINVQPVTEFD